MATYVPAKRATAYITYISLPDAADSRRMKANPTLAAGDAKVSIDGGAFANLATLPTVTPAAGRAVKVSLSIAEMTGDNIVVQLVDQTDPPEWADVTFTIPTAARQIDDLAYPATSGRSMVVDAAGLVDANAVKVGPTGSGTAQTAGDIPARLPAALVSGRMDSSVGAMAANVITATAINADAITDAKVAADVTIASVTGAVGSVTGNVGGNVTGSVGSVATGGITAGSIAADAIGASELAADAIAEIQSGLATSAALATLQTTANAIDAKTTNLPSDPADQSLIIAATNGILSAVSTVDGTVNAILVDTAEIGAAGAGLTALASAANLATVDTVVDAIKLKTDNLPTDPADQSLIIAATDAIMTAVGDVPTNAELAAALAAADDAVLAAIAALNNLSAAQVNAQVLDVLNVDTFAEPAQGVPPATASLVYKLGLLYKALRNKSEVTATVHSIYADDATTVDHKRTVGDDGTTFSSGELAAGP